MWEYPKLGIARKNIWQTIGFGGAYPFLTHPPTMFKQVLNSSAKSTVPNSWDAVRINKPLVYVDVDWRFACNSLANAKYDAINLLWQHKFLDVQLIPSGSRGLFLNSNDGFCI